MATRARLPRPRGCKCVAPCGPGGMDGFQPRQELEPRSRQKAKQTARRAEHASGDRDRGDHLLLVVMWVRAVVVRTYERRVISRSGGGVAEVVADESVVAVGRGARV